MEKLHRLPPELREEYLGLLTLSMRRRLRVLTLLTAGLFLGATLLALYLMGGAHWGHRLLMLGYVGASAALILWLVSRATTLRRAKLAGYAYALFILCVMVGGSSALPGLYSEAVFVILFFSVALLIPWSLIDVGALFLMHFEAWTLHYMTRDLSVYRVPAGFFGENAYLNGSLYLVIAAVVCVVARYEDNRLSLKSFTLLKDVETKKRQMEKELELASRVHNNLIPKSISTPDLDIAINYKPASTVGGDYARFYFREGNRLVFLISDVTGHGVPAALLVNRLHAEFDALARQSLEPGKLLAELNRFIVRDFEGTQMYLSAVCGLLCWDEARFVYSNYGHPKQYLCRLRDSEVVSLESQTTLLGLDTGEGDRIHQSEVRYQKGDLLVLFTDGVPEIRAEGGEQYGSQRLERFLSDNARLMPLEFNAKLVGELHAYAKGNFEDDLFLMSIRTR
ncbi:MAG: hypothetical protein MOGMAGMI_01611 [Candidatus Omnitrophica bacterium]|nr:hypothetical protein [Candidatus Omnitrophota bacterium]